MPIISSPAVTINKTSLFMAVPFNAKLARTKYRKKLTYPCFYILVAQVSSMLQQVSIFSTSSFRKKEHGKLKAYERDCAERSRVVSVRMDCDARNKVGPLVCRLIAPMTLAEEVWVNTDEDFSWYLQKTVNALLMLDGASWHTTGRLQEPGNVTRQLLPTKSPELKPAEQPCRKIRQKNLGNKVFLIW